MRGGVSLDDSFSMSYEERKMVGDIVKENFETTKKTGMPFFQIFFNFTTSFVDSLNTTRIPKSFRFIP